MRNNWFTYKLLAFAAILFFATGALAQGNEQPVKLLKTGSALKDTLAIKENATFAIDTLALDSTYRKITGSMTGARPDSLVTAGNNPAQGGLKLRKPDPMKATWLALVIPGGGQIYNRKFWKLPIVYGGFVGCLYAYNWNGQMYKDYRQAYLDIMDSDPNTDSYKDFFRPGYDYEGNKEYLKEVFKKRKDRYRRWRDLSIFAFIGVYAVSVIDAYVDAQLSNFDISEDIHLSIEPQIINDRRLDNNDYYGLNLNITF